MAIIRILILIICTSTYQASFLAAQTPDSMGEIAREDGFQGNAPPQAVQIDPNIPLIETTGVLENDEIVKSVIVIVFALIIFSLLIFRIKVQTMHAEDFIRLIVLALVICSSMYLISAGWDDQQTAPAFGILGTIAGYLLGRGSAAGSSSKNAS